MQMRKCDGRGREEGDWGVVGGGNKLSSDQQTSTTHKQFTDKRANTHITIDYKSLSILAHLNAHGLDMCLRLYILLTYVEQVGGWYIHIYIVLCDCCVWFVLIGDRSRK